MSDQGEKLPITLPIIDENQHPRDKFMTYSGENISHYEAAQRNLARKIRETNQPRRPGILNRILQMFRGKPSEDIAATNEYTTDKPMSIGSDGSIQGFQEASVPTRTTPLQESSTH